MRRKKHMPVRKGMGERINYWGYGKAYYFAPKASYSASGDPVRELKMLVRELHKNGIELILGALFSGTDESWSCDGLYPSLGKGISH